MLDSLKEEEEDAEAEKIAEEKRRLRTAPPPSTRVRVFDRDECEALRDAPVTKGKVSLLEAAGAPRLIKIDSGRVFWETRAKSTGFVAKCTQHNEYEEEYAAMRANPRLMEAMCDAASFDAIDASTAPCSTPHKKSCACSSSAPATSRST